MDENNEWVKWPEEYAPRYIGKKFECIPKRYPHDNVLWVKGVVFIKQVSTGEVRAINTAFIWDRNDDDEGYPSTYWWAEGNGSCDCNREMYFNSSADAECGDSRYLVQLGNPITKEIFYTETEESRGGQ